MKKKKKIQWTTQSNSIIILFILFNIKNVTS